MKIFKLSFIRRRMLVNPKGQLILLLLVASFSILLMFLLPLMQTSFYIAQNDAVHYITFAGTIICMILGIYLFLVISNRFFGPIYRLHQHLLQAKKEGPPYRKIRFRKGDGFFEISESYNHLVDRLNEESKKDQAGFTMLEILIVIAITGVMLGMGAFFSTGLDESVRLRMETTKVVQQLYAARSIARSTSSCVSLTFREGSVEIKRYSQITCAVLIDPPAQSQINDVMSNDYVLNLPADRNPFVFDQMGSPMYPDVTEVSVAKSGKFLTISIFPKSGLIRTDKVVETTAAFKLDTESFLFLAAKSKAVSHAIQ